MPVEGKSDMERIGLFSEMGYVTIGDKYVSQYMRPFNEAASKNRQMLPGGTKTLSALQEGYFEPQFVRIFEGEAYSNPVQLRRRYRLAESKKNVGKAFLPSNGDKLPCGLGSYYGTIGGSYEYFSPQVKSRGRYIPPGKNLYTNPGKKGSGFGYANLTIGEQYPHKPDDYEAERIKAKLGGMKGGTFDPFPSYSAEPYVSKKSNAAMTGKEGQVFHPPSGPKSRPVTSIVTLNVKRSLNSRNYKTARLTSY
ncbi:cilia-and flagella-associated protein 96 isoform X2 [Pogoniulus pusillus]|uniref:cilia-and flagella-associated protein 96 isoform X2 n=1 Tax=Pogoniulus pusillus TaxID=488313 RepID=UPI0030B960E5